MSPSFKNTRRQDFQTIHKKLDILWEFNDQLAHSIFMARWLGYGLLAFSLLDTLDALVPATFTDPNWELQTFGKIIEGIIIPLLALVAIFLGGRNLRSRWERPILTALSYSAFLFGVLLFLVIPLMLFNTVRIDRNTINNSNPNVERQLSQIRDLRQQLERVTTQEQMERFISRLDSLGRSPNIRDTSQLQKIHGEFSETLDKAEMTIKTHSETMRQNQRLDLVKKSVKWNLGALIAGILFIIISKATQRLRA